jgi:hypothetical protein
MQRRRARVLALEHYFSDCRFGPSWLDDLITGCSKVIPTTNICGWRNQLVYS